jgi:transposase
MDDRELEERLYPARAGEPLDPAVPHWPTVHRELRHKGVTLQLLWDEYHEAHRDGFRYSWFCREYRSFISRVDATMRQHHVFGEKCFVDYAGPTVPIVNPKTGEVRQASIFVGILGASNYTYVDATWSQSLPCWLGSHVRMFNYFGGVPFALVPDNLRSGVTKANYYEPDINPSYSDLAEHYNVVVLPARKRKPRDKAKAENAVLIVERWILAALRKRTFFSLEELNEAIAALLEKLNQRPFQKLPGSRRSLFEAHERLVLQPLPAEPYVFGAHKKCRVHLDYHVEVEGHYYSVPYDLVKEVVEVLYTATTVEILHNGRRVASHARSHYKGRHTTATEHMPPKHQKMLEWTPERLRSWAEKTGPATAQLVEGIMAKRRHPEQGFRACLGVMRLAHKYPLARVEAACQRAVAVQVFSYKSLLSILQNGLDAMPLPTTPTTPSRPVVHHENVRGPEYYAQTAEVN